MNSTFPASYSTLCPIALSSLISRRYEIGKVRCKFLVRGVGDTYLVEAPCNRYILRIYRSTHRTLAQIEEEVKLLLELQKAGVSVSFPILANSGETILKIKAIEGERYGVLFSYASGSVVRLLNEKQLRSLGSEMARFHNSSSLLSLGGARWNFDIETTLIHPVEMLKAVFTEDPEGYNWLQKIAGEAKAKISSLDSSEFSSGYCHFDFLPKNFHFEKDSVTFFDFDFMGYGWLVNDIMTFWQHLSLDVFAGRMTQLAADQAYSLFLDAYREHRSLSEQELAAIPYLSIGFWLFYMGFHTTHDQFYLFSQPSHLKAYTGIIRHIVENYWNKEI